MSGYHGRDPACQSSQGLLVSKTQKRLIKEGGTVAPSLQLLLCISGVITLWVIQHSTHPANSGFILLNYDEKLISSFSRDTQIKVSDVIVQEIAPKALLHISNDEILKVEN